MGRYWQNLHSVGGEESRLIMRIENAIKECFESLYLVERSIAEMS